MSSYANRARAEKAAEAARMGIDEAMIARLVARFYTQVQADAVLGPIFAARVEDWTPHLAQMTRFWTSIAIESGGYHGTPMPKHIAIAEISPAHFVRWLGLWSATVDAVIPPGDAAIFFKARAARIAESLQQGIAMHRQRGAIPFPPQTKEPCDVGRPCC
jgi:hemoglobin